MNKIMIETPRERQIQLFPGLFFAFPTALAAMVGKISCRLKRPSDDMRVENGKGGLFSLSDDSMS